ncbi:MAG: HlyC/CorC family transporter [Gammaproteobacteria bacterium]|tara:strand:- start:117 stop:953 length:837 start_codon:yes stop_codon:yes gene_type:complete
MSEAKDNSWFDKIKDLLGDSPKDKKDLISLLTTAANDNLISQDSYQMILGVFSVSEIPVREIMIPRPHVIAIDVNEELNTVITKVIESGHSRFPVINGKLDEIIGILHAKDLLKNQINTNNDFDLHDYMRPATFIPESKRLNILLNDFKASRNHIAIVIDEHSNVSGLVTLEDLIEEIIGEIDDEHDVSSREFIIQQAHNKYIIDALLALDDFNERFNTSFVDEDIETLGGFLINKFEKVPTKQEIIEINNFIFTVLSADSKKINRIQLIIKKDNNSS